MPKKIKQLPYKKCEQCRKDRQKCLPKDKLWPGSRCDRCLKDSYICSASETKTQESNGPSLRGSENTQNQLSLREGSPGRVDRRRRSEVQCLQDLRDIRQLIFRSLDLNSDVQAISENVRYKTLKKALQDVVKETEVWAQQYEDDGRYKDAAYLYGRIHSGLKEESRIVPTLAAVYEKMGDYPAAELAQEKLLAEGWGDDIEEQTREVKMMSRLLNLFHTRLQALGSASKPYAKFSIVYRAAVFDLEQLNSALLDQGLIALDYLDQCKICYLNIAVKKNAPNLAWLLLQKETNPNLRDDSGATRLHTAVGNGTETIVQLLLNHDANTEIGDFCSNTAIQIALMSTSKNESMLLLLIGNGASVEARDALGRTPLVNAIVSNSPSAAQFLIDHGANVNATYSFSDIEGKLLCEAVRQEKT